MPFTLPELPYPKTALAPHISAETLEYHHGKHHNAYVNNLNKLIAGTKHESMSLEDIIKDSKSGPVFNNAAQVWNHTFYWHSMKPNGGGKPAGALLAAIEKSFGSFENFQKTFTEAAMGQFGSGWAWLVKKADGSLAVEKTPNAETPLTNPALKAILVCDVWEHAYYVDKRNDRAGYVASWWSLVNWEFAAQNFG
ncbi:MAG: superoxide dismutase, Fe [Planctomycetota bacterium]|jgi:Fe-Mn family superoxide dismutase